MTAKEAIDYIHSMVWDRSATGYEHAENLLKKMGNPERQLKYVHIGGTNGKGSTAAMVASVLRKAGYKTGLYTSPFIYRFQERMQINGEQIKDEELAEITQYVKGLVEEMEIGPSEFALVCCIAFEYFKRNQCDIVVLEVGMGGEKDSTNVIPCPEVAVMTNIGLDHTEFLGETLGEIALTKAGIFKEHGLAVAYEAVQEVQQVFEEVCAQRQIELHRVKFDDLSIKECSLEGQIFAFQGREDLCLPLLGKHQTKNAAVAITTIDALRQKGWDITEEALREGLQSVTWPGRFERVGTSPDFIIDGGHNPQCIDALAENIDIYLANRRIVALTGVLEDKEYENMYQPMLSKTDVFVCIEPPSPRKLDAEILATFFEREGAKAIPCKTIEDGVKTAIKEAGEDGVILCYGSLYSIGEIKEVHQKNLH